MKAYSKQWVILPLVGLLLLASGCKKKITPPNERDLQLKALRNSGLGWVVGSTGSVTKDGFDVTSQYADFRLLVGVFTYTVENSAGTAWPYTEGTWQFANETGTILTRDDGVAIAIEIAGEKLALTFRVDDSSTGGRHSGLSGEYVFVLESE